MSDLYWLAIVAIPIVVVLFVFASLVCFCCAWKVAQHVAPLQKISWVWSAVDGVWVSIAAVVFVLRVEIVAFGGVAIADDVGRVPLLLVAVFRLLELIWLRAVLMLAPGRLLVVSFAEVLVAV